MGDGMNLTSPTQVKSWCIENGFHPNKVLGQNFLVDRNALADIVDAGFPRVEGRAPEILEVGPGLGVMTEEMLARGARVTAVEKDAALAARLAEALGRPEGLTVVAGDALDFVKEGRADAFDAMVSNLPYQAGTRILLELVSRIDVATAPSSITVLVQTEVAERLAAGPGSKTRGLAGVWAQLDYDVEIVREVKATCFWPRPQVGSSVVRLTRRADAGLTPEERRIFRRLTKKSFEHRRKQLGSIFKGVIQSTARAEELSNADWLRLAQTVKLDFLTAGNGIKHEGK